MRRSGIFLAFLAVSLAFAPSAQALPKLIIVCQVAADCDFTSVQAAANDPGTNAGDSIEVEPGTYTESVTVPKQLNIFGDSGGARPVITSPANSGITFAVGSPGAGTTLRHLDIGATGTSATALEANNTVTGSDLSLTSTVACAILGGSSQLGPNVTATVTGGFGDCISAGANSTLTGVTVNAPSNEVGVSLAGTMTDSVVNAGTGLQLVGGTARRVTLNGGAAGVQANAASGPSVLSDSVVTANGGSAAVAVGDGAGMASSTNLKLRNVTAYASGAGSKGLEAEASTGGSGALGGQIDARNVIVRAGGTDVVADPAPMLCITCFPGSVTIGYSNFVTGGGNSAGHNQNSDPMLVNPVVGAGQDFHIACSGSPVIGAGVADADNGPSDRDGVTHPNSPSIGAYEFVPCPASGSTAPPGGADNAPPGGPGTSTSPRCKKPKKHHAAAAKKKCKRRKPKAG